MKKVLGVLLFIVPYCWLEAQSVADIDLLESQGDSLYYSHTDYVRASDFDREMEIRDAVLSLISDTTSSRHQLALAKKFASGAAKANFLGNYDDAILLSEKALERYQKSQGTNLLFLGYLYTNYYEAQGSKNNWSAALEGAQKALLSLRDTLGEKEKRIANLYFELGRIWGRLEETDQQIDHYAKAVNISVAAEGDFNPAAALYEHYLALVYGFIGYYNKELESYKNVIRRWEALNPDDKSNLAVAYGSLSTWYMQHGDYDMAEQYMIKYDNMGQSAKQNIQSWSNETFLGRTQVETWYGYADLYRHLGDTLKALEYNQRSLDFLENFGFDDKRNNPHNYSYYKNFVYLNWFYALKMRADILKPKDPEKARDLYQEAYETILKSTHNAPFLTNRVDLIRSHIGLGELEQARAIINEEIEDAIDNKSDLDLIKLYAIQADLDAESEDFSSMHQKYEAVFKLFQRDTTQKISLETLEYNACKPYGNTTVVDIVQKAADNYLSAFLSKQEDQLLDIAYNLSVLSADIFSDNFAHLIYTDRSYEAASRIYESLLSSALLKKDKTVYGQVLERIENMQSRLSWKKFLNSRQRKILNIPDSILVRESELQSALHHYKKSLFTTAEPDEEKNRLWKEKILDVERELGLLDRWYQEHYGAYFNQVHKQFELGEIQRKLNKRQRIIRYIMGEKDAYAFMISKTGIDLFRTATREELTGAVRECAQTLTDPLNLDYKGQAQQLHDLLLPEELEKSESRLELVIVRDDVLHYLPFEILRDQKGTFLLEKFRMGYAPSLLLWNEQLKIRRSRKNKMGVFAPGYPETEQSDPDREDIIALKGANSEARQIAALFEADVFLGDEANKRQFVRNAESYNLLHLAMHSNINNLNSELTNLSFSPVEKDYQMFISELYNMKINADMVVLSACNTGVGELKKGEGLINVSRAFTYAGVPSIVMSLWNVPDKETARIMVSFYQYLKKGYSKNRAMRLAKIDYLSSVDDPTLKHPYYWAGFIVYGNDMPVSDPQYLWIYILGALFLLIFIFRKRLLQFF